MRTIPCSYEERLEIERLLKEGKPYREIAAKINRSYAFISFEIRRAGGGLVYTAKAAQAGSDERLHRMRTTNLRELSLEQIQGIEAAIQKGYSKYRIRALVGISSSRLHLYMKKNHPNYRSIRQASHLSFNERLEALEGQIEIILETIRSKNEQNNENRRLFDLQKAPTEPPYRSDEPQENQELHQD